VGRPRKFNDGSDHIGFRIEPELARAARIKAQKQGKSLSSVLRSFIEAYVQVNSPVSELEKKKAEAEEELEQAKARLEAIQQAIEAKTTKIPQKHIDYYMKHRESWTKQDEQDFVEESAEFLDMDPDEFQELLYKETEEE